MKIIHLKSNQDVLIGQGEETVRTEGGILFSYLAVSGED